MYSFIFRELQESSSNTSAKKKNWTVKYLAARLSSIFALYKDFEKCKAVGTRRGAGHVLSSMQKEMEEVVSLARNDKILLESKNSRTSLDYQSNGTRVQDLLTFKAEECDMQPCPVCRHKCCMPVESIDNINRDNEERLVAFNGRLREWEGN